MKQSVLKSNQREWFVALDMLCAALISFALQMNMNPGSGNNYVNWWVSLFHPWITTLVATGAFFVLRQARAALPSPGVAARALSLFLGWWWVLAQSVYNTNDVAQPFLASGQMLKALVTMLGMALVYDLLIRGLSALLLGNTDLPTPGEEAPLVRLYRRRTLGFCMAAVLLAWLPQLAAAYPVCTNADPANQIRYALGLLPIRANHPLFGTMLIGVFIRIGRLFGSGGLGLTLYTALIAVGGAYAIGLSQQTMRRLGAPRWLRMIALLVCAFGAVYCDNISVLLKDVPYAYALLVLLCEAIRAEWLEEAAYRRSRGHLLRCWIAGLIFLLIRNNGLFVFLPFAAMRLLRAARGRERGRLALTAWALLVPLCASLAFNAAVGRLVELEEPVTLREALSLPFQQTARYVSLHGDEIPQDEREVIGTVLDFERLPYRYDPIISDPVKSLCPADATVADVLPYLRVWARQFLRDPVTHLQATFITNALLLDPQTYNLAIFTGTGLDEETLDALNLSRPAFLATVDQWETHLHALLNGLPFYLTLNTLGFYCILLLASCAIAARNRARGMGLLFLPMFLSMAIIVLGPCIQNQDRYGFPIVYCMPLVLACLHRALHAAREGQRDEI